MTLDTKTNQSELLYIATGTAIFAVIGSPEAIEDGGRGSLAIDLSTGNAWLKTSGLGTLTGWVMIATGSAGTTINPTNNVLPRRLSGTAFADSPLHASGTTLVGIGGLTSSQPGLKANGANLQLRLANDGGFTSAEAATFRAVDGGGTTRAYLLESGAVGLLIVNSNGGLLAQNNANALSGASDTGLIRTAAGVWRVSNGGTGAGRLLIGQNGVLAQALLHVEPTGIADIPFWANLPSGSSADIFRGYNNSNLRFFVTSGGKIAGSLNNTATQYRPEGQVGTSVSDAGNSGASPTSIASYTLPANSFSTVGDVLKASISGSFAGNGNNKNIEILFGGNLIFDTTALPFAGGTWNVEVEIFYTSASAQRCVVKWLSSNALLQFDVLYTATAVSWASNQTLTVRATGAASNDIVARTALYSASPG